MGCNPCRPGHENLGCGRCRQIRSMAVGYRAFVRNRLRSRVSDQLYHGRGFSAVARRPAQRPGTAGFTSQVARSRSGSPIGRNVSLHPAVQIEAPVFIGDNCRIGPGTRLGPNAVIGDNCILESRSLVSHSVVLPGSYIGELLELTHAVVDHNRLASVRLNTEILRHGRVSAREVDGDWPETMVGADCVARIGSRAALAAVAGSLVSGCMAQTVSARARFALPGGGKASGRGRSCAVAYVSAAGLSSSRRRRWLPPAGRAPRASVRCIGRSGSGGCRTAELERNLRVASGLGKPLLAVESRPHHGSCGKRHRRGRVGRPVFGRSLLHRGGGFLPRSPDTLQLYRPVGDTAAEDRADGCERIDV